MTSGGYRFSFPPPKFFGLPAKTSPPRHGPPISATVCDCHLFLTLGHFLRRFLSTLPLKGASILSSHLLRMEVSTSQEGY